MSCVSACPQCGARKRFEAPVARPYESGGTYWLPPVTKRVECPCGHVYVVETPIQEASRWA